ncbi:MAG TPA: hypothetical protein VK874_14770 [Gaiellaceae bacterium]|jgi:hypothetical protein|nr:hypothetical protein [Gaiellaceae bacterium]
MRIDPLIAFVVPGGEETGPEVRVNFGMFAGREATPAELDELAHGIVRDFGHASVVGEHRHEAGPDAEGAVYQVRIEVPDGAEPDRIAAAAAAWAQGCIDERRVEVEDL